MKFDSKRAARAVSVAAGALALASGAAFAGPDITHQQLSDTIKHGPTTVGPDTIYAYAWGSHTCNLGDAPLVWLNGGTPSLAMNAYKLADGRLTQIGVGNAKHACCVANGSGCGTCTSGPGGTLRPGCKDIYGAGFNTGQSRLGPRSGINAFSGAHSPIPAGTGDPNIWRRVQIKTTDMNDTTALYFAEGVYVCADEDPTKRFNNATSRRCTVGNTGAAPAYAWTPADPSLEGTPAIYAWRTHGLGLNQVDTRVNINRVDVPGEGIFHVACKVTALPNNRWLYDYAVFNLTSDRSCGEVMVPVPPGVHVVPGSIGSKDVNYHSDDALVFDSGDWTGTKNPNSVSWVPPAPPVGRQGNAVRYGTMYNYWFTATIPPISRDITLGLFKPGTPTSVSTILQAPRCTADFDNGSGLGVSDDAVDISDLLHYIFLLEQGNTAADIDNGSLTGVPDGGVDTSDLLWFLDRFNAGC